MQARDGVFLEDLCPKLRARRWRQSLHRMTGRRCLYCGEASESIDHVHPLSRGGQSITENCVPACLGCNGRKGDSDAFTLRLRSKGAVCTGVVLVPDGSSGAPVSESTR